MTDCRTVCWIVFRKDAKKQSVAICEKQKPRNTALPSPKEGILRASGEYVVVYHESCIYELNLKEAYGGTRNSPEKP